MRLHVDPRSYRISQTLLLLTVPMLCGGLIAARPCEAQEVAEVEAYAASPLGVGRMTVRLPAGTTIPVLGDAGYTIVDDNDRVLYQAFDTRPVRTALRDLLRRPQQVTVFFLFTGSEPLALNLFTPKAISARVKPRTDPQAASRLLATWWDEYGKAVKRDAHIDQYSPMVNNYLTTMLSTRLGLAMPSDTAGPLAALFGQKQADQAVGMLLGAEALKVSLLKDTMLHRRDHLKADQPLPKVDYPAIDFPDVPDSVAIEPIAQHVPAECFYIRCGNFPNYEWFRQTLDDWGGDLRNLYAQRGLDFGINAKTQRQISLYENALSKLLGPTVIADVALIGTDPFFREGPSMGVLFQARNNFLLARDFNNQRAIALQNEKDCKEQTLDVAGHKVSLISTPDNRVRSYYAQDGDYHLVTTSRNLVERFYEAGAGKSSLATSRGFRYARARMPLSRNDSLFIYLSDEFFRNLLSPRYHIELTRRLQAETDIDLVRLARLAGEAENRPATSLDQLIAGGYLPKNFANRPDGGQAVMLDGTAVDSLRGSQGTFTPVPDMAIDRVTPDEIKSYNDFSRMFREQWGQMDPVAVGIARQPIEGQEGLEHVTIDAQLVPFSKAHLGMLDKILGPASNHRVAKVPGDVAAFEIVSSGSLLGGGEVTHLFGGLRDSNPPYEVIDGRMVPLFPERNVDGYVGGWPRPGMLTWLGFNPDAPVDAAGIANPAPNLWQRSWDAFNVLSNHADTLTTVTRDMQLEEVLRPSQAWLHVSDFSDQKFARFANGFAYLQARRVSSGNLEQLHQLQSQLHVPPVTAKDVAEKLLGGKLVCTVGGQYQLRERSGELPTWISTAFENTHRLLDVKPPEDYRSPPLQWFRGLDLDFGAHDDQLIAHVEIDMQHPKPPVEEIPKPSK